MTNLYFPIFDKNFYDGIVDRSAWSPDSSTASHGMLACNIYRVHACRKSLKSESSWIIAHTIKAFRPAPSLARPCLHWSSGSAKNSWLPAMGRKQERRKHMKFTVRSQCGQSTCNMLWFNSIVSHGNRRIKIKSVSWLSFWTSAPWVNSEWTSGRVFIRARNSSGSKGISFSPCSYFCMNKPFKAPHTDLRTLTCFLFQMEGERNLEPSSGELHYPGSSSDYNKTNRNKTIDCWTKSQELTTSTNLSSGNVLWWMLYTELYTVDVVMDNKIRLDLINSISWGS